MRKGSLDTIIAETREKFDLPMEVEINKYTICSHLKPAHKIHVAHQGPLLSMVQEEALLLKMILLLADKQAPVTCREGLELANLLVSGTAMEGKIEEWKQWHLPHQQSDEENNNDDDSVLLG